MYIGTVEYCLFLFNEMFLYKALKNVRVLFTLTILHLRITFF